MIMAPSSETLKRRCQKRLLPVPVQLQLPALQDRLFDLVSLVAVVAVVVGVMVVVLQSDYFIIINDVVYGFTSTRHRCYHHHHHHHKAFCSTSDIKSADSKYRISTMERSFYNDRHRSHYSDQSMYFRPNVVYDDDAGDFIRKRSFWQYQPRQIMWNTQQQHLRKSQEEEKVTVNYRYSKHSTMLDNNSDYTFTTSSINGDVWSKNSTTSAIAFDEDDDNDDGLKQFVVVMNANARGVSASTIRMAQSVFGTESVYVTKSIIDVYNVLQIVLREWDRKNRHNLIIIPMGGDGTLSTTIQTMCKILWRQRRNKAKNNNNNAILPISLQQQYETAAVDDYTSMISQLPIIAYVPLGTGNAVGSVVGCSYIQNIESPTTHPMKTAKSSTSTTNIFRRIIQRIIRPHREHITESTATSRSLRQLRSVLLHIQDTILQCTTTSSNTTGSIPITELPMIEISSTTTIPHNDPTMVTTATTKSSTDLCFFAGAGFDSLMLNDFKEIKEWSQRTGFLTRLLSSVTGYCVALVVKTLPKTVLRSSHIVNVQVTSNQLNNTYWVDHRRGDFIQPCTTASLYNGTTGIIAGSTVPYYGGKLRLFPFARITSDKLHLRIGRIHPLVGFFNIPKIFAGTYRDMSKTRFGVLDFIGNDFTIQVSSHTKNETANGFPLQHSGESMGPVSSFRLRVLDAPIRFLNLLPER